MVRGVVRHGPVVPTLVGVAAAGQLLVVGRRGRARPGHRGTVAALAHPGDGPVLVVPLDPAAERTSGAAAARDAGPRRGGHRTLAGPARRAGGSGEPTRGDAVTCGPDLPEPVDPVRLADVEAAADAALLAPSVHNTQPWVLVLHPDRIDVRADRGRQLHVLDPGGRELLLSVGAAVLNARAELAVRGRAVEVDRLPRPGDRDLVAVLRLVAGPRTRTWPGSHRRSGPGAPTAAGTRTTPYRRRCSTGCTPPRRPRTPWSCRC